MNVKFAGIVKLIFLYQSGKFQTFMPFPVVVVDLQMSTIGYVNYTHFPKSSHLHICIIMIVTLRL